MPGCSSCSCQSLPTGILSEASLDLQASGWPTTCLETDSGEPSRCQSHQPKPEEQFSGPKMWVTFHSQCFKSVSSSHEPATLTHSRQAVPHRLQFHTQVFRARDQSWVKGWTQPSDTMCIPGTAPPWSPRPHQGQRTAAVAGWKSPKLQEIGVQSAKNPSQVGEEAAGSKTMQELWLQVPGAGYTVPWYFTYKMHIQRQRYENFQESICKRRALLMAQVQDFKPALLLAQEWSTAIGPVSLLGWVYYGPPGHPTSGSSQL